MRELFKFLLDLFNEWAGALRDKERNAEAKQHIADARERADEILADDDTTPRNARLERLHKHGRSRRSGGGDSGDGVHNID